MRTRILIVLLLLAGLTSFAADCDKCFKRRVALYDCDVRVARPQDADGIISWYNLFWPAAIARSTIHNTDPRRDCLSWIDGALVNADLLQNGVLKFGPEYANLPPTGPYKASEYLLESSVTGSDGNYKFRLVLEAGPSREVVKTVEVPFLATVNSAEEAGRSAATQMMPMYETIRKWEINKRNTDTSVAIADYLGKSNTIVNGSLTLKPSKTLLDIGEVIDVEVSLTDCDGVPLRNRKIRFDKGEAKWGDDIMVLDGCQGGEVIGGSATTNDAGKAVVKFKAGNKKGPGLIHGCYVFTRPYGLPYLFSSLAMVQIQVPVPKFWLLTADMSNSLVSGLDTTIRYDMGGEMKVHKSHRTMVVETSGTITAVIENFADDPVREFSYNPDGPEPPLLYVTGTGRMDQFSQDTETLGGQLLSADIRNDNVTGNSLPGPGIVFYYSKDLTTFTVSFGIKANGAYTRRLYGPHGTVTEWWDAGEKIRDYSLHCAAGGDPGDPASGLRITKSEAGYLIQVNKSESGVTRSSGGSERWTKTTILNARLVPYNLKTLSATPTAK